MHDCIGRVTRKFLGKECGCVLNVLVLIPITDNWFTILDHDDNDNADYCNQNAGIGLQNLVTVFNTAIVLLVPISHSSRTIKYDVEIHK